MIANQFRELAAALNAAGCRYLVAGGFAVIAHGYLRLTGDIDLVLDLEQPSETSKALGVLAALGYRPRIPVPLEAFADASQRERWQREKDMLVFSVFGSSAQGATIDLLVSSPFAFAPAWTERAAIDIGEGLSVPFVDLTRLLAMKQQAGRPKDLEDIRNLRLVRDG